MALSLKQKVRTGFAVGVVLIGQGMGPTAVLAAPRPDSIGVVAPTPGEKPRPVRSINVGPGPPLSAEEALWASRFPAPQPVLALDEVIESLAITEATVGTILRVLANDYGLRYGIEEIWWNIVEEDSELISFDANDIAVRELLDRLVALAPRYVWRADGEYINFVLRDAYKAKGYPLNARMSEYKVEDMPYARASSVLLGELYDTTGFAFGRGLRHPPDFGPTVTTSMRNASVREILNEIARQTDMCWSVGGSSIDKDGGILMARRMHVPEEAPFQWVGIRQVLERAGFHVHWNAIKREVSAIKGNAELQLQVGHEQAQLNITKEIPWAKVTTTTPQLIILPSAPRIVAGHMQVPESFAAEILFRYRRHWDTPSEGQ